VSELLVEISDDLFDYEDDVLNNTFNVYRLFLAMYGPMQGQLELAQWISSIERRYEVLLSGFETTLAERYRERCRNAAREGEDQRVLQ
jgi:DNA-binding SARP family transcriptional activator